MEYHSEVDRRPCLLVLTGTAAQIPFLDRARELGYATVIADRSASAPARASADAAVCIDVTDAAAVMAVARQYNVCGALAEQTDVAVRTAAFVNDRLGIPGISPHSAALATDKLRMRDACGAAGTSTPAYIFVESLAEAEAAGAKIGLPVVLKPIDGQASRGVTKVYRPENLGPAFERARAASRSGGVLVEELLVGTEGSVESIVSRGRITVLGVCSKRKCEPPFSYDLELAYPSAFPETVIGDVMALNAAVIACIGIADGLAHLEFIVTARGVALIEVAARGCGARVATDLLPALTGIDVLGLRIRQAAGEAVDIPIPQTGRHGLLRFIELPSGRIDQIRGLEKARKVRGVLLLQLSRSCGDVISPAQNGDGRPGFVMTTGLTRDSAAQAAESALGILSLDITPLEFAELPQ